MGGRFASPKRKLAFASQLVSLYRAGLLTRLRECWDYGHECSANLMGRPRISGMHVQTFHVVSWAVVLESRRVQAL